MIDRILQKKLQDFKNYMPVATLTGPRQSGKTTLVKETFPEYRYMNLEKPNIRQMALEDPINFISLINNEKGMIIDEAQYAPDLFSYIQSLVDEKKKAKFILTGSQNFLLSAQISQSLAGRVRILTLLPLSMQELSMSNYDLLSVESHIWTGGYPSVYARGVDIEDWYLDYIQTYVERDVRQIINIHSLNQFQVFLKLCAGRIGQLLNYTALANEVGVKDTTIRQWIGLLEASYVLYTLKPYYNNFGKRLIKSPKIYFYDTGLACSLLDIKNEHQLESHYLKGGLFENLIINEIIKNYTNYGKRPSIYYWRESNGVEIDLLIEKGAKLIPIEIKATKTTKMNFFKNIKLFCKTSKTATEYGHVIYGGDENLNNFISWRKITTLQKSCATCTVKIPFDN